jgi:hypothetical protein
LFGKAEFHKMCTCQAPSWTLSRCVPTSLWVGTFMPKWRIWHLRGLMPMRSEHVSHT